MNYQQALNYLYGLIDYEKTPRFPYNKVKLRRAQELFRRLGNPEKKLKTIIVAGTKGKGSTSAMLSSILYFSGIKVGLYTSPHLSDFRERIRFNMNLIEQDSLAELISGLKPVVEGMAHDYAWGAPTYFEVSVALAYLYFLRKSVDFAVMEVGLGGRLDATNTGQPFLSVITPISYDHTEILGKTLTEIAGEKAGVIKSKTPLIMAPQLPEARRALEAVAAKKKIEVVRVGEDTGWAIKESNDKGSRFDFWGKNSRYFNLLLPLLGEHQLLNAATVLTAVEKLKQMGVFISDTAVKNGLEQITWPGRTELFRCRPAVILDVAHNPASAHALGEVIRQVSPQRKAVLLFGILKDKDAQGVLRELLPLCSKVVFTTPANPRAQQAEQLLPFIRDFQLEAEVVNSPSEAFKHAFSQTDGRDLLVIAGSFYLAGELRPILEDIMSAKLCGERAK